MTRCKFLVALALLWCSLVLSAYACGGSLEGEGAFTSPNYPGLYPNRQSCSWTLKATQGKSVRLQFKDFELESGLECSYDYVKIFNGAAVSANLVRTACGINFPVEYVGGNVVTIVFVSDTSNQKKGFSVEFMSVNSSVALPPTVSPGTSSCGGYFREATGTVASPNYPNLYPNLASCGYTITVPRHRVVLTFAAVDIETHSSCDYDRLEVYDGSPSGKLLAKICGKTFPARIISTNSSLFLKFTSDSSSQKTGFLATWQELTCATRGGACVQKSACEGSADATLPCDESSQVCCFPKIQNGECGTIPSSFIIGGDEAIAHSWPWTGSLQQITNGYGFHICGCTILTPRWIVTAAHCVAGSSANTLQVVVGEHDLRVKNHEQVMRIQKIIQHENYHGNNDDGFPNDIALIKLNSDILFNQYIQPACLPHYLQEFRPNDNCWISGWGDTKGTGDENSLNQLKINVLTKEVCTSKWTEKYINDGHICIGNGLKGACNGDSGGPLVCETNTTGQNRWVLAGATSYGIRGCQTEGFPNVYTRISYFLPWIEGTIREDMIQGK